MTALRNIISIEDIHVSYKNNTVLKGVSLSIGLNQRWAVIGKNGTGKSTLVKAAGSLIRPQSGIVYVNGKNVSEYSARDRGNKNRLCSAEA